MSERRIEPTAVVAADPRIAIERESERIHLEASKEKGKMFFKERGGP